MTRPARLLQLHGVIVDLIYHVEALPPPGGEAIVTGFSIAPGGGFNAMVAAARSGMAVTYAGAVGGGPLGALVARALAEEGIATLRDRDAARDQGCCTVLIEPSGERTFVAADGAEGHVGDGDLALIRADAYGWSLLSGYALHYRGSRDAFVRWLQGGAAVPPLVFDPSPVVAALPPAALAAAMARATWISANAAEAEVLTGAADPAEAARRLAAGRPPGGGAVVRCGERGSVVATLEGLWPVPAHAVEAIDTNGAGDTHVGAFVAALSRGAPPAEAARYANVAAALSTTRHGPATAPRRETIERLLRTMSRVTTGVMPNPTGDPR
jgi:sugar/nucleoside kinase (ribokinase family)